VNQSQVGATYLPVSYFYHNADCFCNEFFKVYYLFYVQVEQLMILPIAVLKGILIKYEKDEEREVRLLKAK
jgi:hypothetical protein